MTASSGSLRDAPSLPVDRSSTGMQSSGGDLDFRLLLERLDILEKWYEIAIRPDKDDCDMEDLDLLQNEIDDLDKLTERCLQVRTLLNERIWSSRHKLLAHRNEEYLEARESNIPNAGHGLFWTGTTQIKKGEVFCFYWGHIHNFRSMRHVKDKSYLMLVDGQLFVDPCPIHQIKARYINDPLNEMLYNCAYVPDPKQLGCVCMALRDVEPGEELFASYGEMYWSQQTYDGTVLRKEASEK
eukprot:scaffold34868_cov57-Attheya_sp.AAC.4